MSDSLEMLHHTRQVYGGTISAPSISVPASFCVAPQVSTPPQIGVTTPPRQPTPDKNPDAPMSSPGAKADADVPMASPAGTDITMATPSSIGVAEASTTAGTLPPVPSWPEPASSQVQSAGAAPNASEEQSLCVQCGETDLASKINCIFCGQFVHTPPFKCCDGKACIKCLTSSEALVVDDPALERRGGRGRGRRGRSGRPARGIYIISRCARYCISFNIPTYSNSIQFHSIIFNQCQSFSVNHMFHESGPTRHPLQAISSQILRRSAMAPLRLERLNGTIQGTNTLFDLVQKLPRAWASPATLCSCRLMSMPLVET